jgi:formate hydrogenlyase subunit 6/NADH:ubiquinone oxidoreductase subunit I
MLFCFTATGNSLYVAKQLEKDPVSIPQEMRKADRHYKADSIGIVCPLFEFEIPRLVKDFIRESSFETGYFYLVITYGCHHGGVAGRTQAWLESVGRKADYVNTIIMHDNALIVFDMDQQRSIEAEKQVDAHIAAIKADIGGRKAYVQEAPAEETDFYRHFTEWIRQTGPMYTFPLYQVTDSCVGCGTCTRVCPMGCIRLDGGKPVYDYARCANCMACIQACPVLAIQFATVKEPNPRARYRNPHITLDEIIRANRQA